MNSGQGSSKYWIGISAVIRWQNVKSGCKPILRPLSDLEKIITKSEIDGLEMNVLELIFGSRYRSSKNGGMNISMPAPWKKNPMLWKWHETQKLFEYHFDVFHLIDNGLAININEL
ncbi:MAG: hypothetical protein JXR54_09840 [Tannerellaceae bacterium]|nr:hypothetical protein [Tannerellaceae bacterium]